MAPLDSRIRAADTALEEQIVRLRKGLAKSRYNAGAATIAEHLTRDRGVAKLPAVATIWRILSRPGFVTPQSQKRPRSPWKRFEADLPNQCWQADVTHWHPADHTDVEILNIIDDHSRLAIASHARPITTGPDVVDTLTAAFTDWGTPAAILTDNGAIFTQLEEQVGGLGFEGGPGRSSTNLLAMVASSRPGLTGWLRTSA
jgi:transposase InsO family protein